jgi:hypothetical protein
VELLNAAELTNLCPGVSYEAGHAGLLANLQTRYPEAHLRLVAVRDGWTHDGGRLLTPGGEEVASDWLQWVEGKYAASGQNARLVWEQFREQGLLITETEGMSLYLAVPFGSAPDAFQQLEIIATREVIKGHLFQQEPYNAPEDLLDLRYPIFYSDFAKQEITPWRYSFERLTNIRRFLRDLVENHQERLQVDLPVMQQRTIHRVTLNDDAVVSETIPFLDLFPDLLDQAPHGLRFFQDWEQSSAGRSGHRLCEHWFLRLLDYTDHKGCCVKSLIPQWADSDGGLELPKIESGEESSVFAVMADLERFDAQTGYPFSWYFYLLHGNRVEHRVGHVVARGLREGRVGLPECDELVLLRWDEHPYGF